MRDVSGRFWKLRQRFGIAAPRVAVHSHIPWYWRWLWGAVFLGVAAASAAWFYDAGSRFAAFDRSTVAQELAAAKSELNSAQSQLQPLLAIANAPASRLSLQPTAHHKRP